MTLDFFSSEGSDLLTRNNIALTLEEAQNLQKKLGRPMTLTEAVIFGIQLSEHCSYKSSRKFLKTLPTQGDCVVLGPVEDAGVIEIFEHNGESYCIAIGQESHNHPSQVVPYEGAATGIGGIVRDILCMGARPAGVMDQLRLGSLENPESCRISKGVVEGLSGYGNPLGVPNMGGDLYFDSEFDKNCLVNCTAFGTLRGSDLIHSFVPPNAGVENWDLLIVGKPTDNSGFGGASFGSSSFGDKDDIQSQKGAVQEPNPFLERHLVASMLDLFQKLKASGEYDKIAVKDLGAGGVLCATLEITEAAGFGAEIELENLHTTGNYPPHVIACSETQERFCLAVHPDLTEKIQKHFTVDWDLGSIAENAGISVVGKVRSDENYVVNYEGKKICEAPASLVASGILYDRAFVPPTLKEEKTEVSFTNGEIVLA